MSEVTRILTAIEQGDTRAADELLPLVYEELRLLAAQKMSHERPGQTLDATALVHEAYIRLVGAEARNWSGQTHFFAAAAEAARRAGREVALHVVDGIVHVRVLGVPLGQEHRRAQVDRVAPAGNNATNTAQTATESIWMIRK